jgi:hypothetical protein
MPLNRELSMDNWAFFDADDMEITRGWQGTDEQARASAREFSTRTRGAVTYCTEAECSRAEAAEETPRCRRVHTSMAKLLVMADSPLVSDAELEERADRAYGSGWITSDEHASLMDRIEMSRESQAREVG